LYIVASYSRQSYFELFLKKATGKEEEKKVGKIK